MTVLLLNIRIKISLKIFYHSSNEILCLSKLKFQWPIRRLNKYLIRKCTRSYARKIENETFVESALSSPSHGMLAIL